MSKTRKLLASLLSCSILAASLSTVLISQAANEPKEPEAPKVEVNTVFNMVDYADDMAALYKDGAKEVWNAIDTSQVDSPWSAQVRLKGTWKDTDQAANYSNPDGWVQDPENKTDKNGDIYVRRAGAASAAYPGAFFSRFTKINTGAWKYKFGLSPIAGWEGNADLGEYGTSDAAWAFKAPASGKYQFAPLDISFSNWAGHTNNFTAFGTANEYEGVSFGVRITLNGNQIWPEENSGVTLDDTGWALVDETNSPAIPTISDIVMIEGQVLRIEAKSGGFKEPMYANRVYAGGQMTYTAEPDPDTTAPEFDDEAVITATATDNTITLSWPVAVDDQVDSEYLKYTVYVSETAFTLDTLPQTGVVVDGKASGEISATVDGLKAETAYYVGVVVSDIQGNKAILMADETITTTKTLKEFDPYDYFADIHEAVGSVTEPMSIADVETDSPWKYEYRQASGAWSDVDMAHAFGDLIYMYNGIEGVETFYLGGGFNRPKEGAKDYAFLSPIWNGDKHLDTALTFVAPQAGVYTFQKSDLNPYSSDWCDYFCLFDSGTPDDYRGAVRITVDDKVIWPTADSDVTLVDETWAEISRANGVAIPTITDLKLKAGSKLRIEARILTESTLAYHQRVAALALVKQQSAEEADTAAPTFPGAIEKVTGMSDSLTLEWEPAVDDKTADSALTYKVYWGTEAFEEGKIPTGDDYIEVNPGEARVDLTLLDPETDYYAAVVVTDLAGNQAVLVGGPFTTEAEDDGGEEPDPGDDDSGIEPPDAPLTPTMDENSSGIISLEGSEISVGWNTMSGVSVYQAYLFEKDGDTYTFVATSGDLTSLTNRYTFEDLENGNFVIQVVGYNMQGSPIAVYPELAFSKTDDGGVIGPDPENPADPDLPEIPITGVGVATGAVVLVAAMAVLVLISRKKDGFTLSPKA